MTKEQLFEAIGDIRDDYIAEAVRKKATWRRGGLLAACVVLVTVLTLPLVLGVQPSDAPTKQPYKELHILTHETMLLWPWEYRPVYEQYHSFDREGVTYTGLQREIGDIHIGEKIGSYTFTGYDDYAESETDSIRHRAFDVYTIQNISPDRLVAADIEGTYYVFRADRWDTPATWGEVMEEYGLPQAVTFTRFSQQKTKGDKSYYTLAEDDYIWEVLSACQDAPFVNPLGWHNADRAYISFTITSEKLGVYKNVLYVTEDGYLWTNIFHGEYLYAIGEEAAQQILSYAMDKGETAPSEPYRLDVVGTVTEIGDGYFLLDDSVLCKNPADGIVYTVLAEDMRIARYLALDRIQVGDTVQVVYETEMGEDRVIDSAIYINDAILYENGVLIPE